MDVQDLIDRLRNMLDSAEFDMHEEDIADADECPTVPLACDGGTTSGDADEVYEAEMDLPLREGTVTNNSGEDDLVNIPVPSGHTLHFWVE